MTCKCRICGKKLNTETAYKVVVKNKNKYYCSEEEYNNYMQQREYNEALVEDIKKTLCCIMDVGFLGNTFIYKEWEEWKKIAPNEVILNYLTENKEFLCGKLKILAGNEYGRIKYLSTVIKNNLSDYQNQAPSITIENHIKDVSIDEYIAKYLDSNLMFDPKVTREERFAMIINPKFQNEELIAEAINKLSYKEFLETPYWETITDYKRSRADFKCEQCGSSINTCTHHKTYSRHGYEHRSDVIDNDLIVLCRECHQKEHHIDDDEI